MRTRRVIRISETKFRELDVTVLRDTKKIEDDGTYHWELREYHVNQFLDEEKKFWLENVDSDTCILMVALFTGTTYIKYYTDVLQNFVIYPGYQKTVHSNTKYTFICNDESIDIPKDITDCVYLVKLDGDLND